MTVSPNLSPIAEGEASTNIQVPTSPWAIFLTFAWISLRAFGGALAFIERAIVREKRWLSSAEFLGLYGLSQVLPGPTGISFCVLLGDRFFGLRGAAAALCGFLLLPCVVVISAASVFLHWQHVPGVQGALHGMGAASAGLIIHTAARLALGLRGQHLGILVALLSFGAVVFLHWPVSRVVLSLGAVSVAFAWFVRRKVAM